MIATIWPLWRTGDIFQRLYMKWLNDREIKTQERSRYDALQAALLAVLAHKDICSFAAPGLFSSTISVIPSFCLLHWWQTDVMLLGKKAGGLTVHTCSFTWPVVIYDSLHLVFCETEGSSPNLKPKHLDQPLVMGCNMGYKPLFHSYISTSTLANPPKKQSTAQIKMFTNVVLKHLVTLIN